MISAIERSMALSEEQLRKQFRRFCAVPIPRMALLIFVAEDVGENTSVLSHAKRECVHLVVRKDYLAGVNGYLRKSSLD